MANLTIQIRFAWWFKPCAYCLFALALITRRRADMGRAERCVVRAVRLAHRPKPSLLQRFGIAARAASTPK